MKRIDLGNLDGGYLRVVGNHAHKGEFTVEVTGLRASGNSAQILIHLDAVMLPHWARTLDRMLCQQEEFAAEMRAKAQEALAAEESPQ